MKLLGKSPWLATTAIALGLMGVGCGGKSAKEALLEAIGADLLSNDDVAALKADVGWDDVKMAKFEIVKGFKLTDKFAGDLGQSVEIPVPLDVPAQASGQAANKVPSYSLLKKRTFTIGENKITRFEIVSVARYDTDKSALIIDGDKIGAYIDAKDRVKKDNKNQEGQYLIVKGKGEAGLAYLTGTVTLQKNDGSAAAPYGGAIVFTTDSPFVTSSGSTTGQFLLAILDQGTAPCKQGGLITASAPSIGDMATGTPTATQGEVPCIGVLDKYKDQVNAKGAAAGAKASDTAKVFDKVNTVVTDFLGAWKAGTVNLTFVQPPLPKPAEAPPPAPTAPTPPTGVEQATPPAPLPTEPAKIDPPPATTGVAVRPDPSTGYGVNLGCTYTGDDSKSGISTGLVGNVDKYDDYPTTKGWRFFGDVRITNQNSVEIFGDATKTRGTTDRNPDAADGYCLLTTGNQLYNITKAPIFKPLDDKVSEMWQKVMVPANATGIQIRAAFFSMEYPTYVGTQFNDNFYIKFDESPNFIAKGSLNDLAGANDTTDPTVKSTLEKCSSIASFNIATSNPCGDWDATTYNDGKKNLTGALWNVDKSTQGPSLGGNFKCGTGTGGSGFCYPGMIRPRVLCYKLDPRTEVGKTLTLRMGVADAGDAMYDSALAVDSIVFSTEAVPCDTMFSGEPQSKATRFTGT